MAIAISKKYKSHWFSPVASGKKEMPELQEREAEQHQYNSKKL